MQRVLVILAVIVLVTVSLGVGALTANWPFWQRAWAWHAAAGGWPQQLSGPHIVVRGKSAVPLDILVASPEVSAAAAAADTHLLMRVRGAHVDAWFAPGFEASTMVDGRGLATAVLAPLYAQLERSHPGLLDQPIGAWLEAWRQDARGAITPRALLEQVEGGITAAPATTPLNPFSASARLASGPGFHRAALAIVQPGGPASPAAAAQLLASVLVAVEGQPYAAVLQEHLWSRIAAGDALLMLERRNGQAAAHCCLRASAADWLRVGLRAAEAAGASSGIRTVVGSGRVLVIGPERALFWAGSGPAPSGLEMLLH